MQNPLTVINFILSGFYNLFRSYTVWFVILMLPLALWIIDTLLSIVIRNTSNTRYVGLFGRFFNDFYRQEDMRQHRKEVRQLREKRDKYYAAKSDYMKDKTDYYKTRSDYFIKLLRSEKINHSE